MLARLMKIIFPSQKPLDFSRAQIALLSQFNTSRRLTFSGFRDSWQAVLHEEPEATLQRFVKGGLIVQASIEQHAFSLTIPQLKTILKKNGLQISGKKDVLVERLVSSGYDVRSEFSERVWICSELGFSYVTPYLATESQRERDAVLGAKEALARGDLKLAAKIAAEYHYNDIFGSISLSGEVRADGLKILLDEAKRPAARAKEILKGLEIYQEVKKRLPAPFKHIPAEIFNEAADACTW